MKTRGTIGLAILVTLLMPSVASAASWSWRLGRAEAVANVAWHSPCPWRVERAELQDFGLEAEAPVAWASMQDGCRLTGSGVVYLDASIRIHTFAVLCTRILHEVGHLAGAQHSTNPASVMYPLDRLDEGWTMRRGRRVWVATGGDPRCRHNGRPYLVAHAALR